MPACGFGGLDTHSLASIAWLTWKANETGQFIQHARNGGEHKLPNEKGTSFFKLDGYYCDPHSGDEYGYEFYGCSYHGCPRCFSFSSTWNQADNDGEHGIEDASDEAIMNKPPEAAFIYRHPHTGQSMNELYYLTKRREKHIRENLGIKLSTIWECEWKRMVRDNERLRDQIEEWDIKPRLDPRNAFFGGRTNAVKLYHKVSDESSTQKQKPWHKKPKIGYIDVTSLYPTVLKYDEFVIGHPEVIIKPETLNVASYRGLVFCKVRPPRQLYHPCLPVRIKGKLMFPLCMSCAINERNVDCQCPDEERDLTGTWTTVDLRDALTNSYEVIEIYEVYHFANSCKYNESEKSGGLFSQYVNMFLKGKRMKRFSPGMVLDGRYYEEELIVFYR